MKRLTIIAAVLLLSLAAAAGPADYKFTEASDLTLTGKLFHDTPNPYHRIDTVRFKGFTPGENALVREAAGIACAFRTNSSSIAVKTAFAHQRTIDNTTGICTRGYDLYIRKGEEWVYAASKSQGSEKEGSVVLIQGLEKGVAHDCLLYFPIYSELGSVQVGVDQDAEIEALEYPFRHRVALFGSSFSQGFCSTRSGLSYSAMFTRRTGVEVLNLGVSGRCLLQDYFADALIAAPDVDAYLFDTFSNPSAEMIRERLFPFIEKIRAARPGVPLIFQQTIRRESRNFSSRSESVEAAKMAVTDSLMKIAVKKYKDVYYIKPDASSELYATCVDGTHPDDYGHYLWERSIEKPLLRILRRYGLK